MRTDDRSEQHPSWRPVGGAALDFRRLGVDDAGAVAGLAGRCSARSLRNRFFGHVCSPVEVLTDQLVDAVDSGCAIGAFGSGTLAALATALPVGDARLPAEPAWELGMLVADHWQRRGVGSRLAALLVSTAVDVGVRLVVVHVEAANAPALGLARGLRRTHGELVRVELG